MRTSKDMVQHGFDLIVGMMRYRNGRGMDLPGDIDKRFVPTLPGGLFDADTLFPGNCMGVNSLEMEGDIPSAG